MGKKIRKSKIKGPCTHKNSVCYIIKVSTLIYILNTVETLDSDLENGELDLFLM